METVSPKVIGIVAMAENRVIGYQNGIPWHIPGEQKYFAQKTKGHTVLMGRKTFDSLPEKVRPLPERLNVVVTRSPTSQAAMPQTRYILDPRGFIAAVQAGEEPIYGEIVWVIGGQQIYEATADLWDELYLTLVRGEFPGDAYFPDIVENFELVSREDLESHCYQQLRAKRELP